MPLKGRNTSTASNFITIDMRLAKPFDFKERAHLSLYVEMFNLFNNGKLAAMEKYLGCRTFGLARYYSICQDVRDKLGFAWILDALSGADSAEGDMMLLFSRLGD